MSGFRQYNVRLQRDSLHTQWGFRMQGGRDVGQPLTVQRVFAGTASEGELQRGDFIVAIEDKKTERLTHKEAQDLIKRAGGSVLLVINRPPPGQVLSPISPNTPKDHKSFREIKVESKPMAFNPGQKSAFQRQTLGNAPIHEFGVDYSKVKRFPSSPGRPDELHMMNKVQNSLDKALFSPTGRYDPNMVITTPQYVAQHDHNLNYQPQRPTQDFQQVIEHPIRMQPVPVQHQISQPTEDEEDDYQQLPVSERRKNFMKPDAANKRVQPSPRKPAAPRWNQPSKAPDFGVDYSKPQVRQPAQQQIHRPFYTPTESHEPQPSVNVNVYTPGEPAWTGSLKRSGYQSVSEDAEVGSYHLMSPSKQTESRRPPPPTSPKPTSMSRSVNIQNYTHLPVKQYPPANLSSKPTYQRSPSEIKQQGKFSRGPKETESRIVHVQYNSPINMYSKENVQETVKGQVIKLSPVDMPPPTTFGANEPRNWEQSAVYRMVHGESRSVPQELPRGHGLQQKPQYVQHHEIVDDDLGVSDF